jgi:hypothetical protein
MTSTHGAAAYMQLREDYQRMVDRSASRIAEVMEEAANDDIGALIEAVAETGVGPVAAENIAYWAISNQFAAHGDEERDPDDDWCDCSHALVQAHPARFCTWDLQESRGE